MIIKKLNSTSKQDYNYPTFIGHENAYISLVDNDLGNLSLSIRSNELSFSNCIYFTKETNNPIQLSIIYNNNSLDYNYQKNIFNLKGIKFNYEQKVFEENNKIYYLDEINRKHEFVKFNTLNEYKDNNFNNGLILKKIDNQYKITDINDNVLTFNNNGYLIQIEKKLYDIIVNTYIDYVDNKISCIRSDNNSNINITYTNTEITITSGSITKKIKLINNKLVFDSNKIQVEMSFDQNKLKSINEYNASKEKLYDIEYTNNKIESIINKIKLEDNTYKDVLNYKVEKYNDIYKVIRKEYNLITTNIYYTFNENGYLIGQYEDNNDSSDNNVTNIAESIKNNYTNRIVDTSNYIKEYTFTTSITNEDRQYYLSFEDISLDTEVFTLMYCFSSNISSDNAELTFLVSINNIVNAVATQTIKLTKGNERVEGTINFRIPLDNNNKKVNVTNIVFTASPKNNNNGSLYPIGIKLYGNTNSYKGIALNKTSSAINNIYLNKNNTKTQLSIFNGSISINATKYFVNDNELFFNYKSYLKCLNNNTETFKFYYNNFASFIVVTIDTDITFIDEFNNQYTTNFSDLELYFFTKNGNEIIFYNYNKDNYGTINVTKNINDLSIESSILTKNDYITSITDKKYSLNINYNNYGDIELIGKTYFKTIFDRLQKEKEYTYDKNSKLISIGEYRSNIKQKISLTYDNKNNVNKIIDEDNHQINYEYNNDDLIEVKEQLNDSLLKNNISYDKYSNITNITSSTGNNYTFEYDEYGNLNKIKLFANDVITFNHEYFEYKKVITLIYPNNQKLICTYDKYDRLVEVDREENNKKEIIIIYIYADYVKGKAIENVGSPFDSSLVTNRSSKLLKVMQYNGDGPYYSYIYHYDNLNRLIKIEKLNLYNKYFEYDTENNLIKETRTFDKNDNNKVISSIKFENDSVFNNNLLQSNYTLNINNKNYSFKESYEYNELNELSKINSFKFGYGFEYDNKLISDNPLGSIIKTTQTKYCDQVKEFTVFDKKTNSIIHTESLTYDNKENIVSLKDFFNNTTIYEYDELDNLTLERIESSNYQMRYVYDNFGRLIKCQKEDLSNNIISQKTFNYDSETNKDLLTKINNFDITYDENGNVKTYRNKQYFYKDGHKLIKIIDGDQNFILEFKYNENGIRIEKKKYNLQTNEVIETHSYEVEGSRILYETISSPNSSSSLKIYYLYSQSGIQGFIYDNKRYFYEKNILGDIIRIVNENDETAALYEYDAFGNIVLEQINDPLLKNINPFKYRGYYFDYETGLYYCGNRYYYSFWCRWLTPDSVSYLDETNIQGLDLYRYCFNNPIKYVDNIGFFPHENDKFIQINKKIKYRIDKKNEFNSRGESIDHIHVLVNDVEYAWYKQGHNIHDKQRCLGLDKLPKKVKEKLLQYGIDKSYFDEFALYKSNATILSTPLNQNQSTISSYPLSLNNAIIISLPLVNNTGMITQYPLSNNSGSYMATPSNNGQTEILVCIGFIVIAVVAIALIPETGGASLLLLGA